uniref:Uncharacterized protein n=1 Tax=virus sp. ctML55 TaxID=2827627 RepID=A0A8S5RJ76_9VIRU|nr:MAG TPA: hypothetical protein [virus sp. ctML55]DAW92005.1 MAG TPA: hypothetical protein [Bacteriophage sp.]
MSTIFIVWIAGNGFMILIFIYYCTSISIYSSINSS